VRFYALRLNEIGLDQEHAADDHCQGTDWRLFNELRKDLKG
jgi:NitT/TauT family transport system substrate-binding protein